jgi:hypothetical protein
MLARPLTVALGALVLLAACGGARPGSPGPAEAAPGRLRDVVTMEELSTVSSSPTLFEALHALRPSWFQHHPTTLRPDTEGDVVVYIDRSRLGGPESLRTLQVAGVVVVRHYSASEAEARFGLGHMHGAIQVITTR